MTTLHPGIRRTRNLTSDTGGFCKTGVLLLVQAWWRCQTGFSQ
ncbi:hypothetical protein CSUI_006329 [Cystoisospora suis]|uniref:Uncharacterized protein n=1 Tax=Cystoisospora suis TaxID=483139 RepID=A0A2C6KS62_9APIC|nr:hypothetical protein CSUI_006329 [Cystoisospora suis]